jgi:hypothetical protein
VEGQQDERSAEKFRKLMGLKSGETSASTAGSGEAITAMQKQAFEVLDKEYEYARVTTHLNRGKGLGFASYSTKLFDPNLPSQ